jgi:putative FmdB family regulatory protein
MPLFEFVCESCRTGFEALIRRDDEVVTCPDCGGHEVRKGFSAPAAARNGQGEGSSRGLEMSGASLCGKPGCGPMGCGGGL